MARVSPHSRSRELNGLAYADVRHAAADAAGHYCINVLVRRIREILEQRRRLHDLSRLAVAALWNLQFEPRSL